MSEMIERVSRAILAEAARQVGAEVVGRNVDITANGKVSFSTNDLAMAAIKALREPTDAMIAAGRAAYPEGKAYTAMIDAALA